MKLTRRLVLHARMQGGALYRYDDLRIIIEREELS